MNWLQMSISNIVNEHTSLGWVCTRNNVNNIEGNKFALILKYISFCIMALIVRLCHLSDIVHNYQN